MGAGRWRGGLLAATLVMAGGSAPAVNPWMARTRSDLEAMGHALDEDYIRAVYPDPAAWHRNLTSRLAVSRKEASAVRDEAGYRAVLQHFAAAFHDAHVYVRFEGPEPPARWPGFFARFGGGAIRVAGSREPGVGDGMEIASCDGRPVAEWIGTVSRFEVGLPVALETTRMQAALRLFVDRGSPLRGRPSRCVIGGRDVLLRWRSAPLAEIGPIMSRLRGRREAVVSTRTVGADVAWVTLGSFSPDTPPMVEAFRQAMADAPSLRGKRFVVLDVRGNGGGPYNWFMGYLRALYGSDYADYYATARLRIRGVYRLSAATRAADAAEASQDGSMRMPPDPPFEVNEAGDAILRGRATAAHAPYFRVAAIPVVRSPVPPPNPVRAKVYVLTDYGCASACIGFVDELKLFPGVVQIGLPTYVDSRTGTALPTSLPSRAGRFFVATMARDGRVRGDNEAQVPALCFDGDISDDAAVERWVVKDVAGFQHAR